MRQQLDPFIIYGTAWKKDATANLTKQALDVGYRAFDTANQPKHYNEQGLGETLRAALDQGISRGELFVQTKFTPLDGQDERVPYEPSAPIKDQVRQSFESSLVHLQIDTIDSYLLHGPYTPFGLTDDDWQAWGTMELLYKEKSIKAIGISNVNALQLQLLIKDASIKPMVVQNRCFASRDWDGDVRQLCKAHDITYQGFSLLTANMDVLHSEFIQKAAKELKQTPAQVIFRHAIQLGILPLTGTTNMQHMKEDLDVAHKKS